MANILSKHSIIHGKRVSFVELFYDLIFVFCVSSCVHLAGEGAEGSLQLYSWAVFLFCFLCALQIWTFTSYLLNRYGSDSPLDHVGQFSSMFLMYFMINSMSCEWGDYMMFNVSWIIVLGIIALMWLEKLKNIANLSTADRRQIQIIVGFLAVQMAVIGISCTMSGDQSLTAQFMCLGSILWSFAGLFLTQLCHPSHCDFEHLIERNGVLVILVLGELVISISGAMTGIGQGIYCILLFAFAVGVFLLYFSHAEHMVNSQRKTTGLAYLGINIFIVTMISHCTIGLHLLVHNEISIEFGQVFLGGSLCAMLLTTLFLLYWSSDRLRKQTKNLVIIRILACVIIMIVAVMMPNHPHITLFVEILIVFFVVIHTRYRINEADNAE